MRVHTFEACLQATVRRKVQVMNINKTPLLKTLSETTVEKADSGKKQYFFMGYCNERGVLTLYFTSLTGGGERA